MRNSLNVIIAKSPSHILVIIFYLSFFCSSDLFSQPEVKAVFTDKAPVIDGLVNDDVWNRAVAIKDLYQKEPRNGEPITERTEFLFLFDHHNIYLGIRCFDDPRGIIAKELARDVSLGEDDSLSPKSSPRAGVISPDRSRRCVGPAAAVRVVCDGDFLRAEIYLPEFFKENLFNFIENLVSAEEDAYEQLCPGRYRRFRHRVPPYH